MAQEFQKQNQVPPSSGGSQFAGDPVSVGLPWRLMIFSVILLAFTILIFLGLRFGYGTYISSQLDGLDERIGQLSADISEGKQEQFLTFYSQLSNLEMVLGRRGFSKNTLNFLEENTLPSVYYASAEYASNLDELILTGTARSMQDLVQQMAVFGNSNDIEKAILGSVDLVDERVGFEVTLSFVNTFFERPVN